MITISVDLGRFTVGGDGENVKEAMKSLSDSGALEIFSHKACGVCGCPDIVPAVRTVLDPADKKGKATFTYFEVKCTNNKCWAKLALGQSKDTTSLFPKRKDDAGNWIPNNGWVKFSKEATE